jgi:hypothetical protein
MKMIQVISLNGRPTALVAGNRQIIAEHVTRPDRVHVQA